MKKSDIIRKLIIAAAGLVILLIAAISFYRHRHFDEPVVAGPGVKKVLKLSEYFEGIKGSINDCNIYLFEGAEPGGTMLIMAGSHPEEPACRLAAWIMVENGFLDKGRLFVVLSANRSGTTVTQIGRAHV